MSAFDSLFEKQEQPPRGIVRLGPDGNGGHKHVSTGRRQILIQVEEAYYEKFREMTEARHDRGRQVRIMEHMIDLAYAEFKNNPPPEPIKEIDAVMRHYRKQILTLRERQETIRVSMRDRMDTTDKIIDELEAKIAAELGANPAK